MSVGPHLQRLIYYSNYDPSNFGYFDRNRFGLVGKPYQELDEFGNVIVIHT
jgi:hypothetical protein